YDGLREDTWVLVQRYFGDAFHIPTSFWSPAKQNASGFFGSHVVQSATNVNKGYTTIFRLLVKTNAANEKYAYMWRKFCFATWWHPPNTLRVIGIDLPLESRVWIEQSLARLTAAEFAVHPFAIHVVLMEHMIEVYDHAVWFWRDNIRNIERTRSARRQDPDHVEIYELARHAVHSLGMLDMDLIVVSSMLVEHKRFLDERPSLLPDMVSGVRATSRTLWYQMTVLQSLHNICKPLLHLEDEGGCSRAL
ncbi:hypothetical protein LTR56_028033, partial [Elasticomyces elasticus]